MKFHRLTLIAAAIGFSAINAQAQSTVELQQALAQAQAAAAAAQAAAKQAQAALEQALAAAERAQASSQASATVQNTMPVQTEKSAGTGLTITNGVNSATLYGLIDLTYVHQTNANKTGQSANTPRVAWFSGNRWGITGQRKLGGESDLKAIFKLESEFESQTGNMDTPGTLFNRDAWLGMESKTFGRITLGRQNALGRDPAASATYGDPYGSAKASIEEGGYTNNNNFKQLVYYAGSATGTRLNNGVVWKKDFGNIIGGLAYQFGGVTGSFNTGTSMTGSLAYNGDDFTVAGFATSGNIAGRAHTAFSIGGNYMVIPMIRLNAGYFNYKAEQGAIGNRKDNAWTISAKIAPSSAYDFELGYQSMHANNAGLNGSGYVQNAFSDTSAVTTVASGNRNTVYASAFYHFDAATDVYIAMDQLHTTGGYLASQANGFKSQTEFGLGLRFKF